MDKDQRKSENRHQETASERLKRLLAEAKKEQPIESLGDLAKPEKTISKKLEDTSPIQISNEKISNLESIGDKDEGQKEKIEISQIFSEIIKEQYQSIKENLGLISKKTGKKRSSRNRGSQPPGIGNKPGLFTRFGKSPKSCLLYGLLGSTVLVITIGLLTVSFLIFQYFSIAADLPSIDDLRQYASQFETTRIYDRNVNLIYEI